MCVLVQRGCVGDTYAAWECNVLHGAAGVSDTMLLVLILPACTGPMGGPVPGGMDHPPGVMAVWRYGCQVVATTSQVVCDCVPGRMGREPSCMAARSHVTVCQVAPAVGARVDSWQ